MLTPQELARLLLVKSTNDERSQRAIWHPGSAIWTDSSSLKGNLFGIVQQVSPECPLSVSTVDK
jgi:hypothetical protein